MVPPLGPNQPAGDQPPERQTFSLQPFIDGETTFASLSVEGWVERQQDQLTLEFQLTSDGRCEEQAILWPVPTDTPQRRDGLWQHTCLEWFLARGGDKSYWEYNLSPNGDWNVYALEDYRQGLTPDPLYSALTMARSDSGEMNTWFRVTAPLPEALKAAGALELELAVTAVVEQRSGVLSYWALSHGTVEADFHRREGFLLRI